MQGEFIEGLVRYPDDLPCPQADTDLVPRERRYISDITDVRNLRMFQQEFQATRNRISFVFTEEEAREFREWYKNEILYGGAWFLADWPTLHKDKDVPHRFVGHPKYEWLTGVNPGMMGRQIGRGGASQPVSICKVTATVELYDPRKVGKRSNVYTSKLYPYIFVDAVKYDGAAIRGLPFARAQESIAYSGLTVASGTKSGWIYSNYSLREAVAYTGLTVTSGSLIKWIYSDYTMAPEAVAYSGVVIAEGTFPARLIRYDYFVDSISYQGLTIVSGELG